MLKVHTKEGEKEGLSKSYHENGRLEQEGNYKNGLAEGVWKWYHENGQLAGEANNINGLAEGVVKEYHVNGQLSFEGNYKNDHDLLESEAKCWNEDGTEIPCED